MITDNKCMNIMSGGTGGFVSVEACSKGGKIASKIISDRLKFDENFRLNHKLRSSKIMTDNLKSGKIKRCDWSGRNHSSQTKQKMRKSKNIGETNSQYGTCWITKDGVNKKIKKEELDSFIQDGWIKGRK
jgi:hypothetical protein